MFEKRYRERLIAKKEAGLLKAPAIIEGRMGKYVRIGSRKMLNFSSNDYLGLGVSDALREKVARNFQKYGTSASSSRLVSGNFATIKSAENEYARYFGYESALLFPSGYQANIGILSALFDKGDCVLFDKHIHASSVKGITLSGADFRGYNHNSLTHLRRRLRAGGAQNAAVLTESLFSMDGDLLDVPGFRRLKEEFGFFSIVDEAHAFGAIGEGGRGIARPCADVAVGTFGKALGLFGAFVLLTEALREFLMNVSSPLIYSTSLPEAHAASALDILEMAAASDDARGHLHGISLAMKARLVVEGFDARGDAHIIALTIGDEATAMAISQRMLERDVFIAPVRYPTVPQGQAILRIGMTALHDEEDIRLFVTILKEVWHERGVHHG